MIEKLIKAISKVFGNVYTYEDTKERKKVLRLKKISLMDPAGVCLIQSKSDFGKRVLSLFVGDCEDRYDNTYVQMKKNNDLDLGGEKTITKGSVYSMEYLNKINDIFKESSNLLNDESPRIYVADDYPMIIQDSNFKIVLAPRVRDDE